MKRKISFRNRYLLLGDVALIIVSVLGSYAIRLELSPQFFDYIESAVWMIAISMLIKPITYYYFGLYLVSIPIKLTGIAPEVAYNLAVPGLFALTAVGIFSVGHTLAGGKGIEPFEKRLRRQERCGRFRCSGPCGYLAPCVAMPSSIASPTSSSMRRR